jgi:outer membrane protein
MDRTWLIERTNLHGQKQQASIHPIESHFGRLKKGAIFLISGILFLVGQNTYGQTDLANLISYSLKHSHEIKKSDLQVEEAKYIRKEAVGQGLPQIEGKADYSKIFFKIDVPTSIYDMVGADYKPLLDEVANMDGIYMASLGVQITQLIYSQSYWEGLKATKKTQELYATLKNKTEEEVIEEIANSYYQTLSLDLQLQTIEKSLSNLKETYRIVHLNYKNDLVLESNVNRLKVNITNLEVTMQVLQNSIGLQTNYIKVLAGMPSDTTFSIDTATLAQNIIVKDTNFSAFSAEKVPAFQALLKQDEIYKQQIRLAKAEHYPTLAAYGQLKYSSYNITSEIDKMYNMSTIGLQLKVPIFTSGVLHAKVQQKRIRELSLQEDILKSKDLLSVSYNNAITEYQSACNLLAVQKENRDLALKVYNQIMLQYKEGMASMADLINVNSDFLQANNSYNQQMLKCKLSEIKILKASGSLKQLSNSK